MDDFSFFITEESGLSYVLSGSGPLANCSITVRFRNDVTEGGLHVGTVLESSLATFPKGSGVIVTRVQDELFVKDSF